jgi:hypothetical protein
MTCAQALSVCLDLGSRGCATYGAIDPPSGAMQFWKLCRYSGALGFETHGQHERLRNHAS